MFDSIRTIPVRVRPPYDVRIGSGLLGRCGDYLAALLGQRRIAVLADDTVASLYLDTVTAALEDAGFAVCSHIFPSGEGRKNLSTLTELLEFLASEHLTRTDCVAALGGGVTGDMAGFAAAVYLRGIRYVQLPTTLLAAVDSSVGGKTAVDLTAGKNLAGAFCQPAAVICDTDCLKTLPPDVFADGAAEAVKTGVLSDEALFALFEDGTLTADPGEVIARCVAYKAGVVERDEKEQGERKLLNLGILWATPSRSAAAMLSPMATPWRRGWPSSPGLRRPWAGRRSPWRRESPPAFLKMACPPGQTTLLKPWRRQPFPTRSAPVGILPWWSPGRSAIASCGRCRWRTCYPSSGQDWRRKWTFKSPRKNSPAP